MVVFPEPSAASLSLSSGSVLAAATSLDASAIFLRTIAIDLVPDALRSHISARLHTLFTRFSSQLTVVIEESDGLTSNQMFEAAALFLGTKISPATRRIKVVKPEKDEELILTVDRSQEIVDFHGGVRVEWVLRSTELNIPSSGKGNATAARTEHRYFELRFNKKHRDTVLKAYLPHVLKTWKEMKEQRRSVRLHTADYNGTDYWSSVVLNHPASFRTMAMPEGAKNLDPALLRPGRMDVHIHMSYCTFSGFLTLAANYLEIDHHHHGHHALYPEIERLLLRVNATPAEVAGELMKSDDADTALANLITFLQNKENSQ